MPAPISSTQAAVLTRQSAGAAVDSGSVANLFDYIRSGLAGPARQDLEDL